MTVSPMGPGHLQEVSRLSHILGYPVTVDELTRRFLRFSENPRHALLICEDQENILGWIHLECVEDLIEEDKLEIKALVVDEKFRKMGTGKALITAGEKWAKTYQLHTIYLSCNILRTEAHKFYEALGFVRTKTSHFFEKKI